MRRTPEHHVGYLLKSLQHAFRHALETRLRNKTDALSFAHLVTLDQLQDSPGLPGAQLARRLLVTAQTMNQILTRLEREGSIERHKHPLNRRADQWQLTPAGLRRLKAAREASEPVMTQMLSLLSEGEVGDLQRYLQLCVEALEQPVPQPAEDAAIQEASDLPMHRLRSESRYSPKRATGTKPARR
jgi:DNA-binding MarR family transcriptional regulator